MYVSTFGQLTGKSLPLNISAQAASSAYYRDTPIPEIYKAAGNPWTSVKHDVFDRTARWGAKLRRAVLLPWFDWYSWNASLLSSRVDTACCSPIVGSTLIHSWRENGYLPDSNYGSLRCCDQCGAYGLSSAAKETEGKSWLPCPLCPRMWRHRVHEQPDRSCYSVKLRACAHEAHAELQWDLHDYNISKNCNCRVNNSSLHWAAWFVDAHKDIYEFPPLYSSVLRLYMLLSICYIDLIQLPI